MNTQNVSDFFVFNQKHLDIFSIQMYLNHFTQKYLFF